MIPRSIRQGARHSVALPHPLAGKSDRSLGHGFGERFWSARNLTEKVAVPHPEGLVDLAHRNRVIYSGWPRSVKSRHAPRAESVSTLSAALEHYFVSQGARKGTGEQDPAFPFSHLPRGTRAKERAEYSFRPPQIQPDSSPSTRAPRASRNWPGKGTGLPPAHSTWAWIVQASAHTLPS
jgi:hypothetical protein